MTEFFKRLFVSDFMPHGICYFWNPCVLWLSVVSDSLIAAAYYTIPVLLFAFARRRRDLSFHWVFVAFGVFILACGSTHVMAVWIVWHGTYRLDGIIKALTAAASLATTAMLVPLLPALVHLPGPTQLSKMNLELETRVRERTAELEALIETSPLAMCSLDAEGRVTRWSAAAERIFGFTREEALNRYPPFVPGHELEDFHVLMTALRAGELVTNRERLAQRKDGTSIDVCTWASPLRAKSGAIGGGLYLLADITERRALEERLLQSQKLEAIGRLAGGVAHDFNNLLTAICGYNDMLLEELEQNPVVCGYAREIQTAVDRAAALTTQLLAFSRRHVALPRILELNDSVRQMDRMLRRFIGEDIHLATRLDPDLASVKADPAHMDQIIMNLAVNARDAMPRGGTLTIETANVEPGRVMLAISDTGTGMDAATKARLFEPFFTTKEKGRGTGLGLSIVYGIVKQHGGEIQVSSDLGKGAAFRIYLPVAAGKARPVAVPEDPALIPAGSETILVVEDEAAVRKLILQMLRKSGYEVLEAAGGEQALKLASEYAGKIDLLLTDVVMPQVSGPELALKLVPLRPELKVIYMSGYTDNGILKHGIPAANAAFIQKPFTSARLRRRLREALA